jgi:hypothetical protein
MLLEIKTIRQTGASMETFRGVILNDPIYGLPGQAKF